MEKISDTSKEAKHQDDNESQKESFSETFREKHWLAFSKFWYFFSLRTGALIVAFLEITIFMACFAYFIHVKTKDNAQEYNDMLICSVLFNLLITVLLIIGALRKNQTMVMGWLWLRVGSVLTDLFTGLAVSAVIRQELLFGIIFGMCFFIFHNIVMVRSYYLKMSAQTLHGASCDQKMTEDLYARYRAGLLTKNTQEGKK
ncbi:uncharacterized protein [Procambarus clarkii]|uniref:uncharacterized protein n=1 Tax=Procambarus clarkii TaxID=6728 RepID=UPI0037430B05